MHQIEMFNEATQIWEPLLETNTPTYESAVEWMESVAWNSILRINPEFGMLHCETFAVTPDPIEDEIMTLEEFMTLPTTCQVAYLKMLQEIIAAQPAQCIAHSA